MAEPNANNTPTEDLLKQHLEEITVLLNKQRLEETILQHQDMPRHELVESLLHKQHQVGLFSV